VLGRTGFFQIAFGSEKRKISPFRAEVFPMLKILSRLAVIALLAVPAALTAAELKPYQQAALADILATMDAETREFARPQLEQMLAQMGEAEVEMMLTAMLQQAPDNPPEEDEAADLPEPAAPEDLAFNREQYEPALRDAWRASKEFDSFVDATLAAKCPGGDAFAVFGSGWRYEVAPMQPTWTRASNSADTEVQVIGSSYAPQDGRYRFDFSGARNDFDRSAVEGAIVDACKAYREIGAGFLAAARAHTEDELVSEGYELEQAANGEAFALMEELGKKLQALGPAGNAPILTALMSGTRVN
jgi:hypothetical protein